MEKNFRRAAALATVIAIGLGVGGCGSGGTSGADYYPLDPGAMDMASQAEADFGDAELYEEVGASASKVESQVIVTGNVSIRTSDPAKQAAAFAEFVKGEGGLIDFSSQSEYDSNPYASVTARIPADKFDTVLAGLDQFGKITDSSVYNQEVGQQVADLQARIGVLEDSIERLKELMAQATSVEDLIAAENGLTQRQSELDSLNAQLSWLSDQVSMSTLDVNFSTAATATTGFSFEKAWQFLIESFELVAYSLIILVPWALVAGAIAWVAVVITRSSKKKRAAKTHGTGAKPEGGRPTSGAVALEDVVVEEVNAVDAGPDGKDAS